MFAAVNRIIKKLSAEISNAISVWGKNGSKEYEREERNYMSEQEQGERLRLTYSKISKVKRLLAVSDAMDRLRDAVVTLKAHHGDSLFANKRDAGAVSLLTKEQQEMLDSLFQLVYADEKPSGVYKSGNGTFWRFDRFLE